ncbi:centrosomal protein of 72 kDa isoform X2 [Lemur catta]|uniref:centrosomal protein of 72 kDa isoform X2 n=1 Tax=Lemur catta TaxID=9447 RepID=UPI001E26D9FB|nr:centrosomal protein of 72 kDa isoform X2 [Lemur catta]XP_045422486.1 centrosomal protein of 72 kDa isoform X2 [Lemur catta]
MASATRKLVLSEETVRAKSGLAPHRDLAELQSLSIPGTYQEKITHLGNSLMNLTGLKSLDLSRNSLVSLEGIQYLTGLQTLSLYYNCISSLAEVFRLHPLAQLADVDFRLNPVVKNESDYRLFVVHMLPKLRQLDDRPVRESERKASRLHFASEDSLGSGESASAALTVGRPRRPRAEGSGPPARTCSAVDADDEAVLSLIAECAWDLRRPPVGAGSAQQGHEADSRGSQESRHLLSPWSARHQCGDSAPQGQERRSWPRGCCVEKQPPPRGAALEAPCTCGPHTHFPPHSDSMGVEDSASSQKSSLSGQKVLCPLPGPEKYRKRRMPGGRFQGPLDQECLSCLERTDGPPSPAESLSRQNGSEGRSERTFSSGTEEPQSQGTTDAGELSPRLHSAALPGDKAALEVVLLEALLDLVDRYWEGSRSLHSHEVFLAQARHILSSVQEFTAAQDNLAVENEKVSYLTLENESLQSHLASQQQWYAAKMGEVTAELSRTRKEMDDLRQHLDKSLEENSSLKSLLFSMKKEVKNADASATLSLQITGLETSVKRLSGEIVELKQHLEHYDKIQELTQMLQESHRFSLYPPAFSPRARQRSSRPRPCTLTSLCRRLACGRFQAF